jgi:Tfp pilus assembly protein PilF
MRQLWLMAKQPVTLSLWNPPNQKNAWPSFWVEVFSAVRQRNVFFGFCAAMLLVESVAYAQAERSRQKQFADYFAVVEETPSGVMIIRDAERRRLQQARLSLRQGQFSVAFRQCAQVLDRVINHPQGLAILGMAAKLMKEPSLPLPYYERAIQRYPRRALTQAQYGKYLVGIGRVSDGIARLNHAITIDAQLTVAYTWLAQVYAQNKQPELAQQILQRRKAIVPREENSPSEMRSVQENQSPDAEVNASGVLADSVNEAGGRTEEQTTGTGLPFVDPTEEPLLSPFEER